MPTPTLILNTVERAAWLAALMAALEGGLMNPKKIRLFCVPLRFTLRWLAGLLLLVVPGLVLAQVPTYTLVDLGSADVPNGTAWPDADCIGSAAGTDAEGHPVYICHGWSAPTSGQSFDSLSVAVGYALSPAPANQPQPVENYESCCGGPPSYEGLNTLPLPSALQTFAAEAISVSEGGDYVVGYAMHQGARNAIIWEAEVPYVLPALYGSGSQYDSAAYSVNESREAVGESLKPLTAGGSALRATVWIAHAAHELQYMLSPYAAVILTTARWIDCSGNIGAQGWPLSVGPNPLSSNYPHNYLLVRQGAARNCGS
jgi:hypothetical protein